MYRGTVHYILHLLFVGGWQSGVHHFLRSSVVHHFDDEVVDEHVDDLHNG